MQAVQQLYSMSIVSSRAHDIACSFSYKVRCAMCITIGSGMTILEADGCRLLLCYASAT